LLNHVLRCSDGSLSALLTGYREIGQSPMGERPPIDSVVMFA
jgi:hypothetical protein